MSPPQQCFVSYSHQDHEAVQRLCVHLGAVCHLFGLKIWLDERIRGGDYWNARIHRAIEESQVFVALVTNDFFASRYIFDHELPAMLDRHRDHKALIVPVIYRESCWRGFFGKHLQVLPTRAGRVQPVGSWKSQEDGFAHAANGVQDAIKDWFGVEPRSPLDSRLRGAP